MTFLLRRLLLICTTPNHNGKVVNERKTLTLPPFVGLDYVYLCERKSITTTPPLFSPTHLPSITSPMVWKKLMFSIWIKSYLLAYLRCKFTTSNENDSRIYNTNKISDNWSSNFSKFKHKMGSILEKLDFYPSSAPLIDICFFCVL